MRRALQVAVVVFILMGCSAPTAPAIPSALPNRVDMTIEVPARSTSTVESVAATEAPTFTPIPDTPTVTHTLTPTQTNTPTVTATKIKATTTRLVTKAPTRTLRPTTIPTIFLPPTDTPAPLVVQPTNPPAQACCKVCTTGKACGDSCIARDKTCHKPPGCACNG